MIQLPTVTLIALCTRDIEQTGKALVHSCQGIEFGAVKMVSPYRPHDLPEYVRWEYIAEFPSIDEWNREVFYNLYRYFTTEFCLFVHADGFVVNPQSWNPEWLLYDYIGSPWDEQCAHAIRGPRVQTHELVRVGNSVSLRSHKLCRIPTERSIPWVQYNGDFNEDTQITAHNRRYFTDMGCTFAPLELAVHFGREAEMPENQHVAEPFVFHKWQDRNHIYPRF